MRNLISVLIFISSITVFGQINNGKIPFSWENNIDYNADVEEFSGVPFDKLIAEDLKNDSDKSIPWRFGYEFITDIDPGANGEFIELDNGDRIWRVNIQSLGAKTINIFFDWFSLQPGAYMQVASVDGSVRSKIFTHEQNNPNDAIGIWPVAADNVWVELYEPANTIGKNRLEIRNVVHGYRTLTDLDESKALNDSGNCNQDVDCDITPSGFDLFNINQVKEDVKKSAAMLVTGNTGFCSGALVNNTSNNKAPYFMTANHCLGGSVAGWAFRFNWRSTNTVCSTTQRSRSGSFNQTASGATLLMSSSKSDMALVEITDTGFFNNNPDVIWAGWDRSVRNNPSVNFGVHHPRGDIQKTCRDDQGAIRNTRFFNGNPSTEMWLISQWELGVTEPGSSGSPLFNEYGHIIGVLSGGSAACNGTVDNGGIDYYGRVGVGWGFGNSSSSRLSDWLDPNNSNQETLDSFPRSNPEPLDVALSLENNLGDCGTQVEPLVTITNVGAQALTSAVITYNQPSGGTATANYSGTILPNGSDVVTLPSFDANAGSTSFIYTVTISSPNGGVDPNLIDNSISRDFGSSGIQSYDANNSVIFNINTDRFASETSWELRTSSGTFVSGGNRGTFPSNTTNYSRNLPVQSGECYVFTIFDSADDGICCGFGNGSYSLTTDSGNLISSGGEFGSFESTAFGIEPTASLEKRNIDELQVYPNPSDGLFTISNLHLLDQSVTYTVYNMAGKQLKSGSVSEVYNDIDLTSHASGLYLLDLNVNGNSVKLKLLKE